LSIITIAVDDDNIRFGDLETFFKPTLVNEIGNLIGEVVNVNEIKVTRIFSGLKTTKTTTVTRGGKTISMPHFWAMFLLNFPSGTNEENVASILNASSLIDHAGLNFIGEVASGANDSLYSSQHSLQSTVYDSGHINIEGAWDIATGDGRVKVAIIDLGVNINHVDFKTSNGSSVVKGGNYYPDLNTAYNDSNIVFDYNGHGTKAAGIIGAIRNNNKGIAGIAGGVQLYSCTARQVWPNGDVKLEHAYIIPAIADAATEYDAINAPFGLGVNIMNLSLATKADPKLESVVRYAYRNEVTIIASRGNFPHDSTTNKIAYPSCYEDNVVINVGGSDTIGHYWTEPNHPDGATGAYY